MKRIFYILSALLAIGLASCSNEELGENTSSGTREVIVNAAPDYAMADGSAAPQTRGTATIDRYVIEVYENADYSTPANVFEGGTTSHATNATGSFTMTLAGSKDYYCLLWADKKANNAEVYTVTDLKNVSLVAGAKPTEAFYGTKLITSGQTEYSASLHRAVANIVLKETGTLPAGTLAMKFQQHTAFDVSAATVKGTTTERTESLTVVKTTGTKDAPKKIETDVIFVLAPTASVGTTTFTFQYESEAEFNVSDVQIQANYNTNITGHYGAVPVAVASVSLNKATTSIMGGATETLTATISPANATDQNVTWASSNTAVATVSSAGVVTAVAAGTANITVTTTDGSKTATCAVTVTASFTTGILYFDADGALQVGKWNTDFTALDKVALFKFGSVIGMAAGAAIGDAWDFTSGSLVKFNPSTLTNLGVGADAATGYATVPYSTDATDIDASFHTATNIAAGKGDPCRLAGLTVAQIQGGTIDNNTWRLPTNAENGTFGGTKSKWTTLGGVKGYYLGTGATAAGTGGEFLPAAGSRSTDGKYYNMNTRGYYWSSTPNGNDGYLLSFYSGNVTPNVSYDQALGYSVRCVRQ